MMTPVQNVVTLWSWPWLTAKLAADTSELTMGAGRVILARMPVLAGAVCNPLLADRGELALMVTEKLSAFGASRGEMTPAKRMIKCAGERNLHAASKLLRGEMVGPSEWMHVVETNVAACAAMMLLPAAMLTPLRRGVARNEARLSR